MTTTAVKAAPVPRQAPTPPAQGEVVDLPMQVAMESIVAIVFAVLGWTVFPLFGAWIAKVYARRAHRMIDQYGGITGKELADAASRIAGIWFVTVLVVILVAVVGLLTTLAVTAAAGN